MALTNHERVGKALEQLQQGLGPFVERELAGVYGERAPEQARRLLAAEDRINGNRPVAQWDVAALLRAVWEAWNDVFGRTLGRAERSLVQELRDVRNRWAHQERFSGDDAYRALDSAHRLLLAVSAPQAETLEQMKMDLLRARFEEQARGERRKAGGSLIEAAALGALKPWREVVTPHPDVASGRYQQAEFAADLWQVHLGQGSDEYRHPAEFFRRTFPTASLRRLLVNAVRRLAGQGGDPVVQLQTNFGGGKTHSMLALYHLFGGSPPTELAGAEEVLAEAGVNALPRVRRVVLVGNKISPGNPARKPDGTVVRTLWGELAWQLGGERAYARVAKDDERATSPGDVLRQLFDEFGPCLVLIDEWVAYARQLHDVSDLPGGSFETQFTFAQALTESAKAAKGCLLVVSLPASDSGGSPHTQADDLEVGGLRGREALDRLRNVVGRVESSWRPASAEEGFQIVRRRLFEPMAADQYRHRDVTARAFSELYRSQGQEFPPECRDSDYEERIRSAYPIHPEIFDRLYGDWSTLVKFQRTRGVLRLMAAVIHSLWEKGDRSPLILPATIPIDDPRVQFELTRYLSDNWVPIIERDVDGPNSLPLRIDAEVSHLGKLSATRRVARTIFLGSAPTAAAPHPGLEDRRVKLGCVMPGESPAVFGDALRRLSAAATYLYADGPRYWYSTQPTVTKLAEDRAEQLRRDPDKVVHELEQRLRTDPRKTGEFSRIHLLPRSGADVADDPEARLVVLGPEHPYSREPGNAAEQAARAILEARGNGPRLFRNTLVFLAVDKTRWQDLEQALRMFLAWQSILEEREALNLTPFQVRQAETQKQAADGAVEARLPEAYQWLLVPEQKDAAAPIEWQALRLTGTEALAVRASRKLRNEERLITNLGPARLRMELDRVPLWRGDHVPVTQLVEDFAQFPYLPRLSGPSVLVRAIREGVALLTWERDSFAFAERYDQAEGRYQGLCVGEHLDPQRVERGLVVRPEVARAQLERERAATVSIRVEEPRPGLAQASAAAIAREAPSPPRPRRFYAVARLDPHRLARDAERLAEEVLAHLLAQPRAELTVQLEIEARLPEGADERLVRIVTENCSALGCRQHGFERE